MYRTILSSVRRFSVSTYYRHNFKHVYIVGTMAINRSPTPDSVRSSEFTVPLDGLSEDLSTTGDVTPVVSNVEYIRLGSDGGDNDENSIDSTPDVHEEFRRTYELLHQIHTPVLFTVDDLLVISTAIQGCIEYLQWINTHVESGDYPIHSPEYKDLVDAGKYLVGLLERHIENLGDSGEI